MFARLYMTWWRNRRDLDVQLVRHCLNLRFIGTMLKFIRADLEVVKTHTDSVRIISRLWPRSELFSLRPSIQLEDSIRQITIAILRIISCKSQENLNPFVKITEHRRASSNVTLFRVIVPNEFWNDEVYVYYSYIACDFCDAVRLRPVKAQKTDQVEKAFIRRVVFAIVV